ncbi:MAG: zinc ribbon domain-containing protein, partial [Clostridia bacterium]|nr:zinc ribbon domain-containing protein [Clostridia bacterium]
MYCKNCGAQNSDSATFCFSCGCKLKDNASSNTPPGFVPSGKVKNKKSIFPKIAVFMAVLLVVSIAIAAYVGLSSNPKLKLGKTTDEVIVLIPNNGGVVSVSDPSSKIDGFSITVNPGTYNGDTNFDIKTTEITGHTFGEEFNPITPLITVNNGHEFSARPMIVTVPIDVTDDEFAMGFYYDRKTGKLEAIPHIDYGSDQITLLTNHFSDIVVSKISIAELEKLTDNTKNQADSGFEPGKDDWQFINYGSSVAPGGHCAGQSLSMMWYYQEIYKEKAEPRLYGRYDNNGEKKTENFWLDDSGAYRFASAVQHNIDWMSLEFHNYLDFSRENQKRVFYAFGYAILVTGSPQFMGIYHFDDYGNIAGGHAIVAYKVEGNKIYVADPNYPGQKDRYCELGSDGFKPYSSGANAADISENGGVLYTEMNFIAGSALVNYNIIQQQYSDMLDGKAGNGIFPDTKVEIMTTYNVNLDNAVWSTELKLSLDKDYNESLPANKKDTAFIRLTPLANNLYYSLYKNGSTIAEQDPVFFVSDGIIY